MLHIINQSGAANTTLESLLRIVQAGPAEGTAVLLIEDAVYAATTGNRAATALGAAMDQVGIYALGPDLEARGVADRLLDGVTTVDYGGFVDLVVEHRNCQSWL